MKHYIARGIRMGFEIERKFIIDLWSNDIVAKEIQVITQNYLATGEEEVRIRKKSVNEKETLFTMEIKKGIGIKREETTYNLLEETYKQLAKNSLKKPIIKTRTLVELDDHILEIDRYRDFDFIIAEIEFKSLEDALAFEPPAWFGKDVTTDKSYKNQSLWIKLNNY